MNTKILDVKFPLRAAFGASVLFLSAAACAETLYYSGNAQFQYTWPWYLDEALSEPAGRAPNYQDTAVFYKTGWTSFVELDRYVGNLVLSGSQTKGSSGRVDLAFGAELVNKDVPINFQVPGKISVQKCDEESYFRFTNWTGNTGSAALEMTVGRIEVGMETYGGRQYDSYGSAILEILMDSPVWSNTKLAVTGDVEIGDGAGTGKESQLSLYLDEVEIGGVLKMSGAWDVLQLKKDGMAVKLGGLVSAKDSSSHNFFVESRGGVGTLVFANAAGADYSFRGALCDNGITAGNNEYSVDMLMEGGGTQRIFIYRNDGMQEASQNGTVTVRSGKFFFDNSNIKEGNRNGSLILEGGAFGASASDDTSQAGAVYFKSAEIKGGGLAFENFANHNVFETATTDKILVEETLSKTGDGIITVDFADRSGNALDLQGYEIAQTVELIDNWVEIMFAGELSGFDLDSKIGEGIYDANGDFRAENVENATAFFRWAESQNGGYSLQVGFAQVPEPAAAAAAIGAVAIALAARRRRK